MEKRSLPLLLAVLLAAPVLPAEDASPGERDSAFLVSPLAGWLRNEVESEGPPGMPSRTYTDENWEYGLFMMYANPRLILNNTTFKTDVNDTDVWGDILTANLYGDPAATVTWHLGASYLWHEVDGNPADVSIEEPIAKAGVLFRLPSLHLSVNPFLGHGWQRVETDVSLPGMAIHDTENTQTLLYGVSAYWRWRMLYANAKYTWEDNLDRAEHNQVFRFWGCAMFTGRTGLLARFEHAEQYSTTDTSVLVGPVWVF